MGKKVLLRNISHHGEMDMNADRDVDAVYTFVAPSVIIGQLSSHG